MNLWEKSQEVRGIFDELDVEIRGFLQASQLFCIPGCGACCANPKVSASVLEFLPLAFDLYEKGKAESVLEILTQMPEDRYCLLYRPHSPEGDLGLCADYANRGMICRLFGSSSRKSKKGEKEIITCKKIKEQKKTAFEAATAKADEIPLPSSSGYYTQLYNIDFSLTSQQLPINRAIRLAIEAVLTFKFYSDNQEPEATESF